MAWVDRDAVASHARRIGLVRPDDKCFVYIMTSGAFVKVGIAADVEARRFKLQMSSPHPIAVHTKYGAGARHYARLAERAIHEDLRDHRLHGEWFNLGIEKTVECVEWYVDEVRKMRKRDTLKFRSDFEALCQRYRKDSASRMDVDAYHAIASARPRSRLATF